jgi:hypothetical protein
MKIVLPFFTVGSISFCAVAVDEPVSGQSETTAGWVKHPGNPVLGGDLGTCFDLSVLKEGGKYRMWFSWRPRKSIALVESEDGVKWSEPLIVLGPNDRTDWEDDLNRPVVLKNGGHYHIWYTGQARGHSWIGYAGTNGTMTPFTNRMRFSTTGAGCCGTTGVKATLNRLGWSPTKERTWDLDARRRWRNGHTSAAMGDLQC